MNDGSESVGLSTGVKYALIISITLLLIAAGALWLMLAQNKESHLLPALPDPTPAAKATPQEPETVTFSALNDDPLSYLNKSILVTGEYLPIERANCLNIAGPDIRWSLAAESLQLDIVGFERIARLMPTGNTMTVQGVWRLYQGPLGCGKGPPPGSHWYLDAKKIVQPNPLVSEGSQIISVEIKDSTLGLPQIVLTEPSQEIIPTATLVTLTATIDGAIILSPTSPSQLVPTESPGEPDEITPSPTAAQSATVNIPTNTPDPNATLPAATDTPTAIPTNGPGNSTPTFTPETPPLPPTATKTNGGGYPGPGGTPTPTPTATPDPYP